MPHWLCSSAFTGLKPRNQMLNDKLRDSHFSFRQAPFFVLDEVDAALDNVNVRKVLSQDQL